MAEWKVRHKPQRYLGHIRAGDAFPEFLVLWALFPIVFFSFSGSKLPGYILPAIPPLAILTGDYLFRIRRTGLPLWLLITHAAATGVLTFVLLLCPQYMVYQRIIPAPAQFVSAAVLGILAALLVVFIVRKWGVAKARYATLIPLVGLLYFLLGMHGHLLDLNYSARPLAREIAQAAPRVPVIAVADVSGATDLSHGSISTDPSSPRSQALFHAGIRRDLVYGLAFYRDQRVTSYATDGVPAQEHILVLPTNQAAQLSTLLPGRTYQQLFLYETQGLSVYRVYPAATASAAAAPAPGTP